LNMCIREGKVRLSLLCALPTYYAFYLPHILGRALLTQVAKHLCDEGFLDSERSNFLWCVENNIHL